MKTVTVDKLSFKKDLSIIEQNSLTEVLFKWLGKPAIGLDQILSLEYKNDVFAKMENTSENDIIIQQHKYFRYITLTEDNQIIAGLLDSNKELFHTILYID
ncbi:hypothetical protein D0469_20330 [Peribacillus saganii]|uniref:Uncharacterized protein n=1 Tax=Peribacillus saganii TaxID=2303992 RepID=A0A372LC85_9BACI|nr:hypothetical protein [Peribacillus saganii]RFU62595.1 hypothetical protein D0469_20330 [Peribacillus saganii]